MKNITFFKQSPNFSLSKQCGDHIFNIRPLKTDHDFQACVDLQYEIWARHHDALPLSFLKINQYWGGTTAGAFDEDDRFSGFIVGMPLPQHEHAHWSYRLAVIPEYRNTSLGTELKLYQKAFCLHAGIHHIYWSYDPMQSKNAHFNLNKLGAKVVGYEPELYPDVVNTGDQKPEPADRFIVRWDCQPTLDFSMPLSDKVVDALPFIEENAEISEPSFRLEIPSHIDDLSEDEQHRERQRVYHLLKTSMETGFGVVGFKFDKTIKKSFYILEKRHD